jgi:glycosyltransferase involved in cell wall biosynthesis
MRKTYIYLPYADEQGTGMQRFGSEMILALLRSGLQAEVLIGEVHGEPHWLTKAPHTIIIPEAVARHVPRPVSAVARLFWVQFILPFKVRRGSTLLTLADLDLAIFPMMRQIAVTHDLTQVRSLRRQKGIAHDLRISLWRIGLRRSSEVIAISDATKGDLVRSFGVNPERVHVIYEGFDPRIFFPAEAPSESERPYLLYAGTLSPNKNIPFLLRVYAELRELGINVDLQVVGRYPQERAEELLVAVPETWRRGIRFDGFVSDEELGTRMRKCAAFVFPSLSEGFGLAPVEAMACGAPVVSSAATSLSEVVGEGGVLLSPTDHEGWVRELTSVLSDKEYRRELSRRALGRSSAFSWDRAAGAYRMLIERGR